MNGTTMLDNVFWHAMSGAQAKFAVGTATARRFAPGFSPMLGFADAERPDFAAVAAFCEPGERFYCSGWGGPAPAGWTIEFEAPMLRMVWDAPTPAVDEDFGPVPLDASHVAQAVELAALTRPGPFGPRTIELGDYIGCFDGERLVAMAGERLQAGPWRELSGICTHPDFQGRGLARRLMSTLLRRELQRGETPFLHVLSSNTGARRLYERLGFRVQAEPAVRVVSRR